MPPKGQRLLEGKEAILRLCAARAISVLLLSGVLRPFSPYLTGCGGTHALAVPPAPPLETGSGTNQNQELKPITTIPSDRVYRLLLRERGPGLTGWE